MFLSLITQQPGKREEVHPQVVEPSRKTWTIVILGSFVYGMLSNTTLTHHFCSWVLKCKLERLEKVKWTFKWTTRAGV